MGGHPIVTLERVTRTYSRGGGAVTALDGVSCSISAGEFIAVTGPSGSGKSTLLNIIGLTDAPVSGAVTLDGSPINFADEPALTELRRTKLGYVFQSFNLLAALTAAENVALPVLLTGRSYAEALARAGELLDGVGLSGRRDHYPRELSGGEMQRVAVCRAVAHEPKLILADEPTGNLDSHAGEQVLNLLEKLCAAGQAVIMATHSPDAAARAGRRLALKDGRIQV